MVLGRVPSYPVKRNCVIEDEMGKETTVLVGFWWIVREVESVPLEVLPKQLWRQWMVLRPILGATVDALEGSPDRVGGFRVAQLHYRPSEV